MGVFLHTVMKSIVAVKLVPMCDFSPGTDSFGAVADAFMPVKRELDDVMGIRKVRIRGIRRTVPDWAADTSTPSARSAAGKAVIATKSEEKAPVFTAGVRVAMNA
jgi:hypothetical protein